MDIEKSMQIGTLNTMLTVNEKARRRAKCLCFCCGKGGHYISYCPVRPTHPKHGHVDTLCHHPTSPPLHLYCFTLHATRPKRPPNQTNGTIVVPTTVPESQKEAVSPKVSCSNTETLSPDRVIASIGTVVRRKDLEAFARALKARAASLQMVSAPCLSASTAISKNVDNLQNVPTLSDPDGSDVYTDLKSLSESKLDPLYNEQSRDSKAPNSSEPLTIKAGLINK
ncbi:---NA--- [Pelobates cultripes]|uniref:---NA n=1 Tax=Pelobates cultripes TaxID=61616 RepID=A0AAD1RFD4_PELCU|nr:---NA--- [Pelobates cultripes]